MTSRGAAIKGSAASSRAKPGAPACSREQKKVKATDEALNWEREHSADSSVSQKRDYFDGTDVVRRLHNRPLSGAAQYGVETHALRW